MPFRAELSERCCACLATRTSDKPTGGFLKDEYSRECEKCSGEGVVRTGSKVVGQETLACMQCKGMGWVAIGSERDSSSMYVPNGAQAAYVPPAADSAPMFAPAEAKPPEVADLEARGYVIIPPMVAG